jgi:adenylyltransferase/sulfurtransferase
LSLRQAAKIHHQQSRPFARPPLAITEEYGETIQEITATELKQRLDKGDDIQIVDVREVVRGSRAQIPETVHIPLGDCESHGGDRSQSRDCRSLQRRGAQCQSDRALKRSGFNGKLINLKGGIMAWSNEVDPAVPKY